MNISKISYYLSLLCLVHCLAFPILVAVLPLLNIVFEISHITELFILSSIVILGSYSLIHSYSNHHHKALPLVIFYIGVSFSIYVHFGMSHSHEFNYLIFLTEIISGLLIAVSQFYNLRLTPKNCSMNH